MVGFHGDVVECLGFCAEGRGFDPQPGQRVVNMFFIPEMTKLIFFPNGTVTASLAV